jgi:hypothetical protein
MTQRDCPSPIGASKTTIPSFIATIRLLWVPPTTFGASSVSFKPPPSG